MRAPIFILGCHKSGTSLLRALLEGHPDLHVAPTETHFFTLTGHATRYAGYKTRARSLTREQKLAALTGHIAKMNASVGRYADAQLQGRFDLKKFKAYLEAHYAEDDAELFTTYLDAISLALTGRPIPEGHRVVEKTVTHAEFAPRLAAMFPDAQFLHLLRNPYAVFVAVRRKNRAWGYPYFGNLLAYLKQTFADQTANSAALGVDRYLTLRYEDLLADPEANLRKLAAFADLKFTDSLLEPTSLGEPWAGNSSTDEPFDGISKAPLTAWCERILPYEVAVVNRHLEGEMSQWGYERLEVEGRVWQRHEGESLASWARNRGRLVF